MGWFSDRLNHIKNTVTHAVSSVATSIGSKLAVMLFGIHPKEEEKHVTPEKVDVAASVDFKERHWANSLEVLTSKEKPEFPFSNERLNSAEEALVELYKGNVPAGMQAGVTDELGKGVFALNEESPSPVKLATESPQLSGKKGGIRSTNLELEESPRKENQSAGIMEDVSKIAESLGKALSGMFVHKQPRPPSMELDGNASKVLQERIEELEKTGNTKQIEDELRVMKTPDAALYNIPIPEKAFAETPLTKVELLKGPELGKLSAPPTPQVPTPRSQSRSSSQERI